MPNLLLCIGKAVADVGLGELAGVIADANPLAAANLIGKIASKAWGEWRADKKQAQLRADILAAANLTFEQAKQVAAEVARQVTRDPDLQGQVERFVTLVPASLTDSLRRAEDPTGTTLPDNLELNDAEDLEKRLPTRFPRFKPGDTSDHFPGWRLVRQIGAGGFGEVWLAQNLSASNLVNVLKFAHGMTDKERALLNEGNVLNRLLAEGEHPGIVQLRGMAPPDSRLPWIQYEYVAGGDLTLHIHDWQRLPPAERVAKAVGALTQITDAVGHFHALDPFITHRDLKPSNVLYDPKAKRFKIADFGIGAVSSRRMLTGDLSRSLSGGAVSAAHGRGSYSPLYASPQQKKNEKPTPRDDVHALGVVTYQMLTGKLDVGPGTDVDDELKAVGAPDWCVQLVRQATANDPTRRLPDANAFRERLPNMVAAVVPLVTQPVAPPPKPEPPPNRLHPAEQLRAKVLQTPDDEDLRRQYLKAVEAAPVTIRERLRDADYNRWRWCDAIHRGVFSPGGIKMLVGMCVVAGLLGWWASAWRASGIEDYGWMYVISSVAALIPLSIYTESSVCRNTYGHDLFLATLFSLPAAVICGLWTAFIGNGLLVPCAVLPVFCIHIAWVGYKGFDGDRNSLTGPYPFWDYRNPERLRLR